MTISTSRLAAIFPKADAQVWAAVMRYPLGLLVLLLASSVFPAAGQVPPERIRNAIPLTVTTLPLIAGECVAAYGYRPIDIEVRSVDRNLELRGTACWHTNGAASAETQPFQQTLIALPVADGSYVVRVNMFPGGGGRAYLCSTGRASPCRAIDEWTLRLVRPASLPRR